ncbi:hypothetical protein HDU67_002737 [Dinochytrium kinnereticum]|nr:hypothetical protein HDU67_002737 [Dinochytrium kinnereticum]
MSLKHGSAPSSSRRDFGWFDCSFVSSVRHHLKPARMTLTVLSMRKGWTLLVLVVASFPQLSIQQSYCLPLTSSRTCDGYAANVVDLQTLKRGPEFQGDSILAALNDVASFDQWIDISARELTGFLYRGFLANCTGVTPDNSPLRYSTSIMCAKAVVIDSTPTLAQISSNNVAGRCTANIARPAPVLCPGICENFAESFIAILSSTRCRLTPAAISSIAATWTGFCQQFSNGSYNRTIACSTASTSEASSCGFGSTRIADARAFCQSSSDECCARLPPLSTSTIITIATSSVSISTTIPPTSSSTPNESAAAASGVSPAVIGAISGVILAAIAAVAIFAVGYYRKRQRKEESMVVAHNKARMDRLEETIQTIANTNNSSSASTMRNTNSFTVSSASPALGTSNAVATSAASTAAPSTALAPESTFSALWTVVTAYEPQMDDEVLLQVGEFVVLETIYNDGWARGTNQSTRMFGYLPMACLEPMDSVPIPVHDREADLPAAAVSAANTAFAPEVRNSINSATLQHLTMTNTSRYEGAGTLSTYDNNNRRSYLNAPNNSTSYHDLSNPLGRNGNDVSTVQNPGSISQDSLPPPRPSFNSSAVYGSGSGQYGSGSEPVHRPETVQSLPYGSSPYTSSSHHPQKDAAALGYSSQSPFSRLDGSQGVATSEGSGEGDRRSYVSGRPVMSALGSLARSNDGSTLDRN